MQIKRRAINNSRKNEKLYRKENAFIVCHLTFVINNIYISLNDVNPDYRYKILKWQGFPGGAVVKNLPANAGDMGLSPSPGRSHMPLSK